MALLIGTDEAGYGPNLGPLAICGTSWQVAEPDIDFYAALQSVIPVGSADDKLTIADSKFVYRSGDSLEKLEVTVLAMMASIHDRIPNSFDDLGAMLGDELEFAPHSPFAACRTRLNLPLVASSSRIMALSELFRRDCGRQKVRIRDIRCRTVFPDAFNRLLQKHGNKADLLSCCTMQLVRELMVREMDVIRVVCDKLGGRNKYLALIQHHLTDEVVKIKVESRPCSRYSWREGQGIRDVVFSAGGESFLPTALASMVAKYVRELVMKAWNDFWSMRIANLRPTAGYPVDARRFKRDIQQVQTQLGIPDESIWRNR